MACVNVETTKEDPSNGSWKLGAFRWKNWIPCTGDGIFCPKSKKNLEMKLKFKQKSPGNHETCAVGQWDLVKI